MCIHFDDPNNTKTAKYQASLEAHGFDPPKWEKPEHDVILATGPEKLAGFFEHAFSFVGMWLPGDELFSPPEIAGWIMSPAFFFGKPIGFHMGWP